MAIQQITAGIIADGSITANDIAAGSITSDKLAAGAGGQFIDTQSTHVMYYNAQNVTSNVTVSADKNAFAAGPITIDAPYSVTLNAGSTLVIL